MAFEGANTIFLTGKAGDESIGLLDSEGLRAFYQNHR